MDWYSSTHEASNEEEIREHEASAREALNSSLKVSRGEGAYRCPFCPSKKKQEWKFADLLTHATGQGKGITGKLVMAGQHRALAGWLEESVRRRLPPVLGRPDLPTDAFPRRPEEPNRLVFLWVGTIANALASDAEGKRVTLPVIVLKARLVMFNPIKVKNFYDRDRATRVTAVFLRQSLEGYDDGRELERSFLAFNRGWASFFDNCRRQQLESDLYGWLADKTDFDWQCPAGTFFREKCSLRNLQHVFAEGLSMAEGWSLQLEKRNGELRSKVEELETEVDQLMAALAAYSLQAADRAHQEEGPHVSFPAVSSACRQ